MRIPTQPKVIIRHCAEYDPARIREIVREGLEELGLRPHGRTLIKPNIVAAGPLFPHAYTRPEFMEGVVQALRDRADDSLKELGIGERCGITVPSRFAFAESGYDALIERLGGIKRYLFDEVPQVEVRYSHPQRLRDYVFTPQPIADADFFVNCPKFKAHPWTTVTFSMKNYIGIQDDRHRLIDHDHRLNEKIADLQHIIQPQFIAIDAITAGEGRMLTPLPFPLKLIIMGNSQVAFDAVCCHIIGVAPQTVEHIALAVEHGLGSPEWLDLQGIQLSGDVTLEQAQQRARSFRVGLQRIEKYFEGSRITAYAGPPPEPERTDYCWGGCPGAMQEAIEILRLYDQSCDQKLPRLHIVFGKYEGPIPAGPGEKVVFIGDCAEWQGQIGGELVQIRSQYKDRSTLDPYTIKHDDVFLKMAKVSGKVAVNEGKQVLRLSGCPVSVIEQALCLVELGEVRNPYFDPQMAMPFQQAYWTWRAQTTLQRLQGKPYQRKGHCSRGTAQPELGPSGAQTSHAPGGAK